MSAETVVLSLGSNLGDREATLKAGVAAIAAVPGVTLVDASRIVETPALKPHGVDEDAPAYLNAVILVHSESEPPELLEAIGAVERRLGRERSERWGDRTLDIDIVAWGDRSIATADLTVPHPRAHERAFVLAPWLDVDSDARLHGEPVSDLLSRTGDSVSWSGALL